jgi:hypothetical protein
MQTLVRPQREIKWDEFLASLLPWERNKLTKDETELILHDAYIAREISLRDIRLELSFELPLDDLKALKTESKFDGS